MTSRAREIFFDRSSLWAHGLTNAFGPRFGTSSSDEEKSLKICFFLHIRRKRLLLAVHLAVYLTKALEQAQTQLAALKLSRGKRPTQAEDGGGGGLGGE